MTRRRAGALLAVVGSLVLLAGVSVTSGGAAVAAKPTCGTPKTPPCPSPSPSPTVSSSPTPTASPSPTATVTCGGPITISVGGTYSGCYQSTSTGTPAVTVATAAPVTLAGAHIIAKGNGVVDSVSGVNLTISDSTFDQTDPGAAVEHRAVILDGLPAAYTAVHNQFNQTDGQWIGTGGTINTLVVRGNLSFDVGRYPHPTASNCCVQFLQLDHVTAPTGVVAYNRMQNVSGQSGIEDNINIYVSGGSDSTHRLDVSHNLVDGAYPLTPSNTQFTGGGIMAADGNGPADGGHTSVHDNTVVSTTNYGVACASGTDCHAYGNVTVNDRLGSDGSTFYNSDFGQAYSMHNTDTNSDATSGSYNWLRNATDGQQPCWMPSYCSGLVQVPTTEAQARSDWTAGVPAAELPIGPR